MKIGYLFPGQGAQYVGMGKDLYENFPAAQAVFEDAEKILGYSLSKICFEGPEGQLTQTVYAQPAIFTLSIATLRVLEEKFPSLHPSFSAGLSLGEFSALVGAKAISFEDSLKLVKRRGEAMEHAASKNPGTMASILGLNQEACQAIARESGCELANLNSPDQFVVSGTFKSIDRACELAEAKGAKRALKLKVGGAFHSRLMKEAKEELGQALQETKIDPPDCIFIPNAVGRPVSHPEEIRMLLAKQLMSSVEWIETMHYAKKQALDFFLELGPGKVLKGLAKKIDKDLIVENCSTSEDLKNMETLFQKVNS